ncbi:hypothetical protein FZW96_13450 [Bacillus sp. BGMRC 2118]|nr:hypothetical protein FZW96_13450 [Bacillus sp. BGMRC 2118]
MKYMMIFFIKLTILLNLTGCTNSQEPEMTLDAKVSKLTEEEFRSIGTFGLENLTKEDFMKVQFLLHINHSFDSRLEVEGLDSKWMKAINNVDGQDRYWFGSSSESHDEDITDYSYEFVIYTRGLTRQQITDAYKDISYTISSYKKGGEKSEEVYKIGEMIEFD